MPPVDRYSRHLGLGVGTDSSGRKFFLSYRPFRFRSLAGNVYLEVQEGETLAHIADRFYGKPDLWWVLADFNNILDPTQKLDSGRTIIVPPRDFVLAEIVGT